MENWATLQTILTGSGAALVVLAFFVVLFVNGDIISKKSYERIIADVARDISENMRTNMRQVVKEEFTEIKVDLLDAVSDTLARGRTRL